jgi:hypothetical protein
MAIAGDRIMALQHRLSFIRHVWDFIRMARLSGGGESRDVWKIGLVCIKRWSPRIPPAEVRQRCRVSRAAPVCNSMWYVRWLHWTLARWHRGHWASHESCNAVLASWPLLADLHPQNILQTENGLVVIDFGIRSSQNGQVKPQPSSNP